MKENNTSNNLGFGEINTIRNILMGQHIADYDTQFKDLYQKLELLEKNFQKKLDALEGQTNKEIAGLKQTMNERFDKLEKMLLEKNKNLDRKLMDTSKNDKDYLGKLFEEVSKKLLQ